jgi:peptidoglycan hydrolase-like protein with peptidoglycan-binding domain
MSVDAFSALPLQAGQAVAGAAGRTAMWAISAYLKAPLRNTAIAALTTLSAMAGSNALYNQAGHHPAPLFGTFDSRSAAKAAAEPVMPVQRPAKLMSLPAPETTGSVAPKEIAAPAAATPIGNEDVFEVQRKLTAFKLFDGKIDGLYGPRTARAIKAFQTSAGQEPTGKLTAELVALIKSTPITAEPAKVDVAPTVAVEPRTPAPVATEQVQPLALTESETPLPAPHPLVGEAPAETPVAGDVPALAPLEEAGGISTLEMTSPPATVEAAGPTKRTVQTIAVRAPAAKASAETVVQSAPIDVLKSATDPNVVGAVQRGLASLGFLHGEIDGVAGEATAKAIRNFEVYYNYNVTGRITPELVNLLVQNGAVI